MNIFVLDLDPVACAHMHCDAHVIKMPTESAQMLSTALALSRPAAHAQLVERGLAYRATHAQHPCTKWVARSRDNALWLADMALALTDEHGRRYAHTTAGKHGHASRRVLQALIAWVDELPDCGFTEPAQAMPEHLRVPGDPVAAYRSFYSETKARFATWRSPASPPVWWPYKNPHNPGNVGS